MNAFREMQWRSPDLVCPTCGTCSMSVFLRCMDADRECLPVASCDNCHRDYDPEVLPTYREKFEALRARAGDEPCPTCNSRRRLVRSLCDRTAKECFFLLVCSGCGDVRAA